MRRLFIICLVLIFLTGCNSQINETQTIKSDTSEEALNNFAKDTNESENGKENEINMVNETDIKLDLTGIPDDLKYMWATDSFGSEMPEKNQIKKIAMYWYQPAFETDPMSFVYECIDFSDNKIYYTSSQTPGWKIIDYNLLEEDETRYLETIDYDLFTEGVKDNNKWNASIEYENGECYLYNLSYERGDRSDPKCIMLKTLFDKAEMKEIDVFYAAF